MKARLDRLAALSAMKRDADLARLRKAAHACSELQEQLDRLRPATTAITDPALFRAGQAHLAWLKTQRMALNTDLAQKRAVMLEVKAEAARSVARASTLAKLQARTHSP